MSVLPFSAIVIAVPWLSEHDAIGNDAFWQHSLLAAEGNKVFIYADGASENLRYRLISWNEAIEIVANPNALIIYHHGVFWQQGENLIRRARCRRLLKYHNITPPEFFRPYDAASTSGTERGRDQTSRFLSQGRFDYVLADSLFNIKDLENYGLSMPPSSIAAPFSQIQEFNKVRSDPVVLHQFKNQSDTLHILFVGRVVPNKGHLHLIEVLYHYIEFFGSKVKLHVVGSISLLEHHYFEEIEKKIGERQIAKQIIFHQQCSLSAIKALFQSADAFLLMSEHEGFCVPILECQHLELPIVALDRAAVSETLGPSQLLFEDLNYDAFAVALSRVHKDDALKKQLVAQGQENLKRFRPEVIMQTTRESLLKLMP